MILRRFFAGLLAASILAASLALAPARAESGGPAHFVEALGNDVVALLRRDDLNSFAEREAAFRELLLSGFDIPTISRFVLGSRWRDLSADQLDDYLDVFTDFVVRIYAIRFDGYSGEQFNILSTDADMDGDTIVRTRLELADAIASVSLDFRVRESAGAYKIIDVYVEGTSMLITQRSEFAAVIDRHGLNGLIDELRSRVDEPVEASEN